jgi:pyridinium-3,5-biscarboxylic acid mononucleotide synthase
MLKESFVNLGDALPDTSRKERCGRPEAVFGPGKTPRQVAQIARELVEHNGYCLCTRVDAAQAEAVLQLLPGAEYDATSRLVFAGTRPESAGALRVGVISAGTADQAVAEECARTLDFYGWDVEHIRDVGVAGIHRLLSRLEVIRSCSVLVVVAGMEGALPSVVGGLVRCPVIAVPTSIGYGSHMGGIAPLLTMLNSCATGITVVNIDNGFGAACAADAILRLASGGNKTVEASEL